MSPNVSEHWTTAYQRNRRQQKAIYLALKRESARIELPCIVTLTRLGPRELDEHDNLRMSFKFLVDEIADYIIFGNIRKKQKGMSDNDPRITWQYRQERNRTFGIRVEIAELRGE